MAVVEPTIGCRQYADRLGDRGFSIAKSTVQRHLVAHKLGTRAPAPGPGSRHRGGDHRVDHRRRPRRAEPFGFCLATGGPGELVCVDSFYIGNLKGVGKVYQLTAIDVFTRWAVVMIVLGPVNATHTMRFVDHVLRRYRRHGIRVRAVLTDNGPEYKAGGFRAHLAAKGLRHQRIPARSPNHNAVCERFHGTILQECWRPAFHRRDFTPSANSKPKPTPGSSPTITADATTATTCAAEPPTRSSTTTSAPRQHDHQPQSPSATSTLGPEALGQLALTCRRIRGVWICCRLGRLNGSLLGDGRVPTKADSLTTEKRRKCNPTGLNLLVP